MARTAKTSGGGTKGSAKSAPVRKKSTASRKTDTPLKAASPGAEGTSSSPSHAGSDGKPESIPKTGATGSRGGWLVLVVVLVAAVGVSYLAFPYWYPVVAEKIPALPALKAEDPRVGGLSARIAALETQAGSIKAKDEIIARLEKEREALTEELTKALARLNEVEQSMASVRQMAETAANLDRAEEAQQSLQRLGDRLAALEQARGGADAERQMAQSRDLAKRLEQTRQQAASTGAALAGMEERLRAVEKRPAAAAAGADPARAATVLAVGQLREAAGRGGAFEREFDAVKALSGDDPGFAAPLLTIGKHAKTGVADLAALRLEFSRLAGDIVMRARGQTARSWFDKAIARVGALVTVRRTEGGQPGSVDALVSAAEKSLTAGDLTGAVKAVEAIGEASDAAAEVAAPWLGRAKTRLTMERALSALHIYAVSTLGGGPHDGAAVEKE